MRSVLGHASAQERRRTIRSVDEVVQPMRECERVSRHWVRGDHHLDFNGVRTCPHRDAVGAPAPMRMVKQDPVARWLGTTDTDRGARGDRVCEEGGWWAGLGVDLHVSLFGAAQQPGSDVAGPPPSLIGHELKPSYCVRSTSDLASSDPFGSVSARRARRVQAGPNTRAPLAVPRTSATA
jgi:hypothetical protein